MVEKEYDFMKELKAEIKFSYEDYKNLPESETKRYELLEGDLIMVPSPGFAHQRISGNIEFLLRVFIQEHNLGILLHSPFDVILSEENVVQPDILFVSKNRLNIITEQNIQGSPDLVIEIFSPSTTGRDRTLKRTLYAKYGVKEYWLVDPETKTIEVLRLAERGYIRDGLYKEGEMLTSSLLKGLRIDLKEIF